MTSASGWRTPDRTRNRAKRGQKAHSRLPPSSRLAIIRNERDKDHVAVLGRLLRTLEENEVPGPQLFRLGREFSKPLGEGSEGNVRCINDAGAAQYRKIDKRIRSKWPFELIAIKQHRKLRDLRQTRDRKASDAEPDRNNLASRFLAAECEVLALSPSLFRNHPNIVQLKGWGLCLDTIENGGSSCCGPLQVPLLVLERADMNLSQFVQRQFSESMPYRSPDLEEAASDRLFVPTNYSHPSRFGTSITTWESLASWVNIGEDLYETLRLLCIDVGHGLEALHQNKFTHGDLKPENILIFRNGLHWTAKLCDFGCARGEYSGSARGTLGQKEPYHGTEGWLPPVHEADGEHNFDGLRRCDIYVYGLVIWSCFYLQGEPPENPSLASAKLMVKRYRELWRWYAPSHRKLIDQIERVFECTLSPRKSDRVAAPWRELYKGQHHFNRAKKCKQIPDDPRRGIASRELPSSRESSEVEWRYDLLPEEKMGYRRKRWWFRACNAVEDKHAKDHDSLINSEILSEGGAERDGEQFADPLEDGRATVVSSTVLSSDDNLFSNQIFETDTRHKHSLSLHKDLLEALRNLPARQNCVELYYLARFRSRIPLAWWWLDSGAKTNILELALKSFPAVDICTLAWLCKGPVGNREVANLSPEFFFKENALHSVFRGHCMNESERLERFLLLVNFGARIEKGFASLRWIPSSGPPSILAWFLSGCRPATFPIVIKETCRRFGSTQMPNVIATSTSDYMNSSMTHSPQEHWSQLQKDLYSVDEKLPAIWAQATDTLFVHQDTRAQSSEDTPLLPSLSLPPGWKRHGYGKGQEGKECFEDEYSHSFTLEQPQVSLMETRQLKIGFLDSQIGGSCYLDLAHYITPWMSFSNSQDLDQNIANRFPMYDDLWFSEEWRTIPPRDDVLRKVKEITPFTIRIPDLGFHGMAIDGLIWSIRWLYLAVRWILMLCGFIFCLGMLVLHVFVFAMVVKKSDFIPEGLLILVSVVLFFAVVIDIIILVFGLLYFRLGSERNRWTL